jgi:hypothetical protein
MWELLGSSVKGFLSPRDLFGYLVPGIVFVALASTRFVPLATWRSFLADPDKSFWLVVALLLVLSYLVGQVLVAVGYTLHGVAGTILFKKSTSAPGEEQKGFSAVVDEMYYRHLYPSIFVEADRRSTTNIMRINLAVGLLSGAFFVLHESLLAFWVVFGVGLFLAFNGYTGMFHVSWFTRSAVQAAARAEESHVRPGNVDEVEEAVEAPESESGAAERTPQRRPPGRNKKNKAIAKGAGHT